MEKNISLLSEKFHKHILKMENAMQITKVNPKVEVKNTQTMCIQTNEKREQSTQTDEVIQMDRQTTPLTSNPPSVGKFGKSQRSETAWPIFVE